MAKKRIDVVSNGVSSGYDIVVEDNTDESGAVSPARALQVGGKLVSDANRIPTKTKIEDSAQRTPQVTRTTTSGTVAAGSVYISIANLGNANATVAGAALDPGLAVEFPARIGETLGAITYDATGTILLITKIS